MMKKQAEGGGINAEIYEAPAVTLGSWGLFKGLKVRIGSDCLSFDF